MQNSKQSEAIFPITMLDEWSGEVEEIEDLFDLATTLEFYDDFNKRQKRFTAIDGSRLRAIVHELEVLLCRRVADQFQLSDLVIQDCVNDKNQHGVAEVVGQVVHRALIGVQRLPVSPLDEVNGIVVSNISTMSLRQFNQSWMTAS